MDLELKGEVKLYSRRGYKGGTNFDLIGKCKGSLENNESTVKSRH